MQNLDPTTFARIDKLELSNSSVNMFHSCERKIEFRKFYGSSRRDESLATGAGSAMHEGVQSFIQDGDFDKAVFEMMMHYPIKYQKSPMDSNSLAGSYATLHKACNFEKLRQYELAYFQKPDGTVVPGIEIPFVLRLADYPWYPDGGTITVDYVGYIDLIMFDPVNEHYVVWDIKTTTKDVDMSVQFAFDEQCLPYGLVLESLLGNNYRHGFDIAYWVLKYDHIDPKNKFYPFMKSQNDVQEWMRKYLMTLNSMKTYYNMGWFPRRGNACMAWRKPCQFFDMCATRDSHTLEQMIAQENANLKPNDRPEPWIVINLQLEAA